MNPNKGDILREKKEHHQTTETDTEAGSGGADALIRPGLYKVETKMDDGSCVARVKTGRDISTC